MKMISHRLPQLGLAEYFAYSAIRSRIRPLCRAKCFAIGLVVDRWEDVEIYRTAAQAFIEPDGYHRMRDISGEAVVFDDSPRRKLEIAREALRHERAILIFQRKDLVPVDILPVLDAVVEVARPTPRQIRGVMRWLRGIDIVDQQASLVAEAGLHRLRLIMRPGRPVSRALSALADIEATPEPVQGEERGEAVPRLEEMAGYGAARDWGLQLSADLADWRSGRIGWQDVDPGLLLSGPPGTGKTIFARALARSCDVPLVHASAARWQAKGHLGDFLKAMIRSFDSARAQAPSILFIDELDAFGDRADEHQNRSYDVKAINGLLECLDGTLGREGVVVVAACNNPDMIDPAILRSGRLDRHIVIGPPDTPARKAIFRMHVAGELADEELDIAAATTSGLSGADIARIVREARRAARKDRRPLEKADLQSALPHFVEVSDEQLRAAVIHEIGHAVVGTVLGLHLSYVAVSPVIPESGTAQFLGGACFETERWKRRTLQHYFDLIALHMAGMAAEELFLGSRDDGSAGHDGSDLEQATKVAIEVERLHGFGSRLASYGPLNERVSKSLRHSDAALMKQVDTTLRRQLDRARYILGKNEQVCVDLQQRLLREHQIAGDDVRLAVGVGGVLLRAFEEDVGRS